MKLAILLLAWTGVAACAPAPDGCPAPRGASQAFAGASSPGCESSALRAMAEAVAAKLALRGLAGEELELELARAQAVELYRRVHREHPWECELAAQAAFRAGELLRAGGDLQGAIAEWERARDLAPGSEFGARALLEIGHVHRRAGRWDRALSAYERLVADPAADARQRDRASWWLARVLAERGEAEAARRALERLAECAEDPLLRVRAYDAWIRSLVQARRLEEAAGVLGLCRGALAERAAEHTSLGLRVAHALERMSAPAELAAAVEERMRARATIVEPPRVTIDERLLRRRAKLPLPPP